MNGPEPTGLLNQSDYFHTLTDQIPIAIIHYEAVRDDRGQIVDFRFHYINQAGAQLTQRTPDQIIGRTLSEMVPVMLTDLSFTKLVQAIETNEALCYEQTYEDCNVQGWFTVTVTPFRSGALVTVQDITAQKRAELEKQQQAELLQSVINNSPSAVSLYEPVRDESNRIVDFRYVLANMTASTILGKPLSDLIGNTFHSLLLPPSFQDLFERLVNVWETGETQRFEGHTIHNGAENWSNVTLAKQGDNVLGVFQFINELKAAQRQLEQQNSALAQSNESLQSFAYVASHDLQEPLRKIQAFSSMLMERYTPALGPQGANLVERMDSAAGRMAVLIRDLLTLARLTTEPHPFRPVSLDTLVADVLNDLETVVQRKQAIVEMDQLCTVHGDPLQLRQLFQNLISNALKFSKAEPVQEQSERPHIQITCHLLSHLELPAGVTPVQAQNQRSFYAISVADNGIGFSPEQAEHIFGAFQRLHARSQYEGSGIGLAIARRVVDNHGGMITAEGYLGQGATFTVYLPLYE